MREAGVQWQREEIFWHEVQPEPRGPFNWSGNAEGFYNYDKAIGTQVANGVQVLGLLDYNPAWYKGKNPHPDAWLKDWGDFVYAAVARYGRDRGWIKYWELWNEPNLAASGYESGLYDVRDFVRILEVGRAAAKAADPEAKIVMGGLASIWGLPPSPYNYDYFDYLLGVGEYGGWEHVDILSIHLYRPGAPEGAIGGREVPMDLRSELDKLDSFLIRYGPKPIWITELGWPTHTVWPGVDEDTQAFYMIRAYILAIAHPSVEKLFWYDFRNDTAPGASYTHPIYDDSEEQFHYGLLRRIYPLDRNDPNLRKPSFLAYRTLTDMLGGLSLQAVIADGNEPAMPGVYWYRFGSGERKVDILWRVSERSPMIEVPCQCKEAMVRSWKGEMKQLIYSGGDGISLHLESTGTPMYVEYDPPIPTGAITFPATGHTLRGAFKTFWYRYGGAERFGFPITEELIEPEPVTGRPRVVQYFDRARFEHFPEHSGTIHEVQLSHLGTMSLERQGIDWRTLPRATYISTDTLYFEETGHSVRSPFREVWQQYGGVPMIGYPLSEAFEVIEPQTGNRRVVQYFERARLEYEPRRGNTPHLVEFGLLSRELFTRWGGMAFN